MFFNNIKLAIRGIKKNKVYSSINILGFAFSISVFLLIAIYLIHENSFDSYHENSGSIYRLIDSEKNNSNIDYRVSEILQENFQEVNTSCIVQMKNFPISVNYNNSYHYIDDLMSVDNSFFKTFSIEFVSGNSELAMPTLNSVVITESAAKKIFGNENPVGKEIKIMKSLVTVSAVIKDFPKNSSINANIIVNVEKEGFKFSFSCDNYKDVSSHRYPVNIYFKLNKNAAVNELLSKVNKHIELFQPYSKKLTTISLEKMYLEDTSNGAQSRKGNPFLLNLLLTIAIIILCLAIINYVNLKIAQQSKVNKSVGIKKILGANRFVIIVFYLTEAILITSIAFVCSLLFLNLSLPFFNEIIYASLDINILFRFPYILYLLSFVLIIGMLSGIIPSMIISSINPIKILGSATITKRKSVFRNALTVFQFTVSIALIFCITVIYKQIDFVKNKNVGFEKEQLLRLDYSSNSGSNNNAHAFIDKLRTFHNIKNASLSKGVPGLVSTRMGFGEKGIEGFASIIDADLEFLETFKIKQIMGRRLLNSDLGKVCMINRKAYEHYGWDNLENRRFNNGQKGGYEVIGVIENFNFASLHNNIEPLIILFKKSYYSHINIRIAGGRIAETMEFIKSTWKENISYPPLKYEFYDDWFDSLYRNEERLAKTISLFALLAICISSLGILGLAIFTTENSKKEIGIRKVYGARVKQLILMLNLDYIKWVSVAVILAIPIGWFIMKDWLEGFAYKTEISWWVFFASAFLSICIALLTVSWHTWKAAMANPVDSLRNE